jgi:hypothetical protein
LALVALVGGLLACPGTARAHEKWFYDATPHQTHWESAFESPRILGVGVAVLVTALAGLAWRARRGRDLIDWLEKRGRLSTLAAVGHRVVHGGRRYSEPQRVTPELVGELRRLSPLDPAHLPGEIAFKNGLPVVRLRGSVPRPVAGGLRAADFRRPEWLFGKISSCFSSISEVRILSRGL